MGLFNFINVPLGYVMRFLSGVLGDQASIPRIDAEYWNLE